MAIFLIREFANPRRSIDRRYEARTMLNGMVAIKSFFFFFYLFLYSRGLQSRSCDYRIATMLLLSCEYNASIIKLVSGISHFRVLSHRSRCYTLHGSRVSFKRIADRDKYFVGSQRRVVVLVVSVKSRVVVCLCVSDSIITRDQV